jgi:hypothetical protein
MAEDQSGHCSTLFWRIAKVESEGLFTQKKSSYTPQKIRKNSKNKKNNKKIKKNSKNQKKNQ